MEIKSLIVRNEKSRHCYARMGGEGEEERGTKLLFEKMD